MPKLASKIQKEVDAAKAWGPGGGFSLLPEGRYAARLHKVEEREARSTRGFPSWSWEFRHLHDEDGTEVRGRQWLNTSLSPKARGGLKAPFEAMGYSVDSDTDEMLGEWAVLFVTQEVQEQGKKAGQLVNRVQGISEFVPDDWDFDPDAVPEDTDDEDKSAAADDNF